MQPKAAKCSRDSVSTLTYAFHTYNNQAITAKLSSKLECNSDVKRIFNDFYRKRNIS